MEVFRFPKPTPSSESLILSNAEIVNGLKSVMWIDRYRDSGEFTLVGKVSDGLREFLPEGTIISHTDTSEMMIVENHVISEEDDSEPEITITGRSFETFLENRIIGANGPSAFIDNAVLTLALTSGKAAAHAVTLIEDHVRLCSPYYVEDAINNMYTVSTVDVGVGTSTTREIKIGTLYEAVLDLLKIDDLGIKSVRPGPWSPFVNPYDLGFVIHQGEDLRDSISFSYDLGEIKNAEYLWSNKNEKNSYIVQGKWIRVRVNGPGAEEHVSRKVGFLDASDIDDRFTSKPVSASYTSVVNAMTARGFEALSASKPVAITRAEISESIKGYKYGRDYTVGDIVAINGNYGVVGAMRVEEQVSIMDETGFKSYPTLSPV